MRKATRTVSPRQFAPSVTSTRAGQSVGDAHGRPSEEDLLLLHSLRLIGCADALQLWPELASTKVELEQSMFAAPNKSATEALLYFLLSTLTDKETVRKRFKNAWPAATLAEAREFRLRAVELIKERAEDWGVSADSISLLPALLQRNAGQKLVRMLCELSLAAMRAELTAERSTAAEEDASGVDGAEAEAPTPEDGLAPAAVAIGQARIRSLQRDFLQLATNGSHFAVEMRSIASEIMSRYAELQEKEESMKCELPEIAECPPETESTEETDVVAVWRDLLSKSREIEVRQSSSDALLPRNPRVSQEIARLAAQMQLGDRHPHAVSGEELLTLMTRCFGEEYVRNSLDISGPRSTGALDSQPLASSITHGKTEVDLLSMTCGWTRCGVKKLVDALEPLPDTPRQAFVRELIESNASLADLISQRRELHNQNVERLEAMKTRLEQDLDELDISLDIEDELSSNFTVNTTSQLPSLLSILKGEAHGGK